MSASAEFRLPVTSHVLGSVLTDYPNVTVDIERSVPTGETTHYAWVEGERRQEYLDALEERTPVSDIVVVDELPDRLLVRFEAPPLRAPLEALLAECDAALVGLRGTAEGWTARFRFPDSDALGAFYDACRERGVAIDLLQIYESGGVTEEDDRLTSTQDETITAAYDAGYFKVPREITLSELSDRLGVSEQAVSERLRRGLSSLLTSALLGDEEHEAEEVAED